MLRLAALAVGVAAAKGIVDFRSVDGQLLANGVPFRLKGAVWRGAADGDVPAGISGVHAHPVSHYVRLLARSSFNAVSLDFSHQRVLDARPVEGFDAAVEPGLVGRHYLSSLLFVAQEAAREGLLVALSCARLGADDRPGNGLWRSGGVPEAAALRSWSRITNLLCAQENVFAVNLFEAPHGESSGGSNRGQRLHPAGALRCAPSVAAHAAPRPAPPRRDVGRRRRERRLARGGAAARRPRARGLPALARDGRGRARRAMGHGELRRA